MSKRTCKTGHWHNEKIYSKEDTLKLKIQQLEAELAEEKEVSRQLAEETQILQGHMCNDCYSSMNMLDAKEYLKHARQEIRKGKE